MASSTLTADEETGVAAVVEQQPPRRRSVLVPVLKLVLGCLLIGGLVWSQRTGLGALVQSPPTLSWLVLGTVGILVSELLGIWRWHLLLRAQLVPCNFGTTVRLGFIGLFFNMFLPGAVGGDVLRAVYLGNAPGCRARVIVSVILDRLLGLCSLGLLACLGVCGQWPNLTSGWKELLGIAAGAVVGLATVSGCLWWSGLWQQSRWRLWARARAAQLGLLWTGRSSGRLLAMSFLLSVISQGVAVGAFWSVLRACPAQDPGLLVLVYVCPMAWLAGSLPLTPGGLGLTEGAYQALLGNSAEGSALGVALTYRVCVAMTTLLGLVFYLTHKYSARAAAESAAAALEPSAELSRAA
jgi:uncharacterized membrane protein YbhN (UPF0104 family)